MHIVEGFMESVMLSFLIGKRQKKFRICPEMLGILGISEPLSTLYDGFRVGPTFLTVSQL